jgi:hypothetical protein
VLTVFPPRRDLLDRPVHHVDDLRLRARRLEQPLHILALETLALRDLVDECRDFRPMQVEAPGKRRRAGRLCERRCAGEQCEEREAAAIQL